jgi:SAM-dependent methyltransferase
VQGEGSGRTRRRLPRPRGTSGSFDAVYALNCLLHVPSPDLPSVLAAIEEVLVPGGLLYVGTWGGVDEEGSIRDDHHPVPAFSRSGRTGG